MVAFWFYSSESGKWRIKPRNYLFNGQSLELFLKKRLSSSLEELLLISMTGKWGPFCSHWWRGEKLDWSSCHGEHKWQINYLAKQFRDKFLGPLSGLNFAIYGQFMDYFRIITSQKHCEKENNLLLRRKLFLRVWLSNNCEKMSLN